MDRPKSTAALRREGARVGWTPELKPYAPARQGLSASDFLRPGVIAAGGAAAAGIAALVNYQRGLAAERAHPPIGLFLDVGGVAVHCIEKGEGPPLVLLHGNGAMVEDFVLSGLMDRLAENHRVIAFDRPGFGYTERPRTRVWTPTAQAALLRRAVQRLGVEKPLLIGHSWGAMVAMAWGLAYPRDLAGLMLMSGYYYPTPRRDVLVFAPPGIPVIGDVLRYTISPPVSRLIAPKMIERIFAPRPVPRRFAEGFPLELSLRPWQLRASAEEVGFMIPWAAAHQNLYRDLRLPVTIITGDQDGIITGQRQSMRLRADIPHSRLRVLPGLGHMIHYFAQDEIVDLVGGSRGKSRDVAAVVTAPGHQPTHPAQAGVSSPAAE